MAFSISSFLIWLNNASNRGNYNSLFYETATHLCSFQAYFIAKAIIHFGLNTTIIGHYDMITICHTHYFIVKEGHELGSRHTTVFACFLRHSHIFYSILKKEKNVRWISDFTDNVPILYSIILTLLGGLLVFTDVTLIVGGFVSKLHFYLYLSVYLSLKMCQKKKNFRIFKRQTK